jgi:hypothetical protein
MARERLTGAAAVGRGSARGRGFGSGGIPRPGGCAGRRGAGGCAASPARRLGSGRGWRGRGEPCALVGEEALRAHSTLMPMPRVPQRPARAIGPGQPGPPMLIPPLHHAGGRQPRRPRSARHSRVVDQPSIQQPSGALAQPHRAISSKAPRTATRCHPPDARGFCVMLGKLRAP